MNMQRPSAYRYLSLDVLRGLSIFGMVLSAIEPYGVLPGWMYHVQNPPPSHELDMGVPGIGWVDLVFPIFIFCMGAAIPLSGGNRIAGSLEKGRNATAGFLKTTLERFGMLWLFSYLYVFINSSNSWVTLAGFLSLFPLYLVYRPQGFVKRHRGLEPLMRWGGLLLVAGVIAVNHFCFGEVVSHQRRGIIIFLLAFLYLFGSLIWYFTRDSHKARAGVWGVVLAFTLVTQYLQWPVKTYADPALRWWFNVEYFYFLLLLLPATYVGDLLQRRFSSDEPGALMEQMKSGGALLALLSFALVAWLTFAFYMQIYWWNLAVSAALLYAVGRLVARKFAGYREMFTVAAYLIFIGILMEPYGGGIKKVPCTIQYCLATCGMAVLLLVCADYLCSRFPGNFLLGIFSRAGKNPLMGYIAYDSFLLPLMKVTGLVYVYQLAYPQGMVWAGLVRAVLAVLVTMWTVGEFTRRKILWKA